MVKEILGRIDDYVYSTKNVKINLCNISNTLKDTKGVLKLQTIQNSLDKIEFLNVIDSKLYTLNVKKRIDFYVDLKINYVDDMPNEASGKFRILKNNVKYLI